MQDMEFVYTSSVKCAFFVVFLRNLLQKQATNNHCETYTHFSNFSVKTSMSQEVNSLHWKEKLLV